MLQIHPSTFHPLHSEVFAKRPLSPPLKNLQIYQQEIEEREKEPLNLDSFLDQLELLRFSVEQTLQHIVEKYYVDCPLTHSLRATTTALLESPNVPPLLKENLRSGETLIHQMIPVHASTQYPFSSNTSSSHPIQKESDKWIHAAIKDWSQLQQELFQQGLDELKKNTQSFIEGLLEEKKIDLPPFSLKPINEQLDRSVRKPSVIVPIPSKEGSLEQRIKKVLDQLIHVCFTKNLSEHQLKCLLDAKIHLKRLFSNNASEELYTSTLKRIELIWRCTKLILLTHLWGKDPALASIHYQTNDLRFLARILHFPYIQEDLSFLPHKVASYPSSCFEDPNGFTKILKVLDSLKEKEADEKEGFQLVVGSKGMTSSELKKIIHERYTLPAFTYLESILEHYPIPEDPSVD